MSFKRIALIIVLLLILAGGWYAYRFFQKVQPPPVAMTAVDRQTVDLLPLPAKLQIKGSFLELTNNFGIELEGPGSDDARIVTAVRRIEQRLSTMTEDKIKGQQGNKNIAINIKTQVAGPQRLKEDESYSISVGADRAVLEANTIYGALRGVETLLQLIDIQGERAFISPVQIQDNPRFPWRGLMLDVARHWIPRDLVLQNLEAMAMVKLNVLHLHLTDYQGFRVESKVYPKLQEMGSGGDYYSQKDIQIIVATARNLGIRVVPEFDLPGHSTSWFVGYPELASAPGPYQLDTLFGILPPVMDPTKEGTYTFLDNFFKEMAALFPDEYVHIGGDEIDPKHWESNPEIQAFMKSQNIASTHELHAYFNQRVQQILGKHGKKMVGWDEISHPKLGKDAVIQSWRGQNALFEAVRNGNPAILSAGYYLDHKLHAGEHYLLDPQVMPGAISIEPDPDNWQTWDLITKIQDNSMESQLTLFGPPDNLRGFLSMMGNRTSFEKANLENNQLSFDFTSNFGDLHFEANLEGDQLNGEIGLGLLSFDVSGTKSGGNDISGTIPPEVKKVEPLTPEQMELILGGEACLWTELVDQNNLNTRLWPRLGAIAEKFWTPADLANNIPDMYRRLESVEGDLEYLDFNFVGNFHIRLRPLIQKDRSALQPVKDLVDIVEEVKYYGRMAAYEGRLSTNTPLNGVADLALPESKMGKKFNNWAKEYADDPSNQKAFLSLKSHMLRWQGNHAKLETVFEISPEIKKFEEFSLNLRDACRATFIVMNRRNINMEIKEEERQAAREAIERASQPVAGVELSIIPGLKILSEL